MGQGEDGRGGGERKRKSVRFSGPPSPGPEMVPSLLPHLPGLDPQALYVISGPFPQQEEGGGAPNMVIMATPVPQGVTVVAVPAGHPPAPGRSGVLTGQFPAGPPGPPSCAPPTPQPQGPGPQGAPRPSRLHLIHWDLAHPAGHPIPLRQPNPPVYYSVEPPSGSQSPTMSCSDLSEDSTSQEAGHWAYPPYPPCPPWLGQPYPCQPPAYHQPQPYMPPHAHYQVVGGQHPGAY